MLPSSDIPPPRAAPRHAGGLALAVKVALRVVCLGVALAIAGISSTAAAQGNAFVLGDLRIPAPTGYVNDLASVLSGAQRGELEQLCRTIDRETGAQIAIAIVPGLQGEEASDVKTRLFEAWAVGHAADNRGLLILHALEERRIEIEVGYGLEPVLSDAGAGRVLDRHVVPRFRENQFFEGYRAGLLAIREIIARDPDARGGNDAYGRSGRPNGDGGIPLGVLLFLPVLIYLFIRHPRLLLLLMLMGMSGGRGGSGGGFGGGGAGRSY